MNHLGRLFRSRELLLVWTWREIRVRYKQSVLGALWAVLQPFCLMLILTVVFSMIVRIPTGDVPYPLFSYAAVLPWSFFAASITLGVPSLTNSMNMVTKVSMPKEILPVATVLAGLVDFGVAAILFVGMLLYYRVTVHLTVLWILPLLAVQVILTIGVVLLGSALNVLYRDIRFMVPLGVMLWMYATPIIYPVELIPEHLRFIYYLNPMAPVIDGYRKAILDGSSPDLPALAGACIFAILLLGISYAVFKRLEPTFADVI